VSITGPTSSSSYSTTSSTLALGGAASDDKGVVSIAWSNDRGGSGMASGTSSWSVPSVTLQGGTNVITITAQDAAGNKGTGVLTVDYSAPAGTAPAPAIDLQANEFSSGRWLKVQLTWSYVDGKYLEVYRNNEKVSRTSNNGTYTDSPHGSGPYTYFVCVMDTDICSNTATVP